MPQPPERWAPHHVNPGRGILRGSWQELELRYTPRLRPRFSYKDVGRLQGREIRARIMRRMDLWQRVLHSGLVGDARVEGDAREGRDASDGEE